MSDYGFNFRVLEVGEDGAAIAGSTTPSSLLPSSAKEFTLAAGWLQRLKALAFCFTGRISTLVTSPGTLTLDVRLGSVNVFSSGAMALNVNAQTNVPWKLEGELVCRQIGTGTSTLLFPKAPLFESHAVVGSPAPTAGGVGAHILPFNAAPAVGSGFDFSVSNIFDLYATWSVANAANSIQLHCGHVDIRIS